MSFCIYCSFSSTTVTFHFHIAFCQHWSHLVLVTRCNKSTKDSSWSVFILFSNILKSNSFAKSWFLLKFSVKLSLHDPFKISYLCFEIVLERVSVFLRRKCRYVSFISPSKWCLSTGLSITPFCYRKIYIFDFVLHNAGTIQ